MERLIIPLINEVFGKDIPEDTKIEHLANEQFRYIPDIYREREIEKSVKPDKKIQETDTETNDKSDVEAVCGQPWKRMIKRVTDTLVRVDGRTYHFECESKNDGRILIRVVEYDMQIAFQEADYFKHQVKIRFPDTAVVFVRTHRKLPKSGSITYQIGEQEIVSEIPYISVGDYDLEILVKKHLFLLFPFYLMRYEHALKNQVKSKFNWIEKEAEAVYNRLTESYEQGIINKTEFEKILALCRYVVQELAVNRNQRERMVEHMGPVLLMTPEEIVEARGKEIGKEIGKENTLVHAIKCMMENGLANFDQACNILRIGEKEKLRFKGLIKQDED